jgi:two-component system osmolarity sensor histidine kinase EnvZ
MTLFSSGVSSLRKSIKDALPHSLFGRSLLILVTPIFLVQIITTFIFFDRHWQKMGDRLAYSVANEVLLAVELMEADETPAHFLQVKSDLEGPLGFYMRYQHGATLANVFNDNRNGFQNPSRENFIAQTLSASFDRRLMRPYNIVVESKEKWVDIQVQLKQGVLSITVPERRIFSSSGFVVLLWMLGSSIILVIIATLFMRNQIKPIRRLAVAAERFGKGRDVPFFKIEGAREVRQAAQAFIGMKDRLGRQIHQRTAMLAGVSHDLRTPITRMKLQLEMMEQSDAVRDMKSDLVEMENMIGAYLQFARGEGGEEAVRTDLRGLIDKVAGTFNRDEAHVFVDGEEGDLVLSLRPVAFERCLGNLIGNALKYGRNVWVSARRIGDNIEICIDDDGPGIPPEQYEDVFKPFFRGESSRNSKTGGIGLGLPIVQDIVHAHGGRIWLDKSPKGGLRAVIDLPV